LCVWAAAGRLCRSAFFFLHSSLWLDFIAVNPHWLTATTGYFDRLVLETLAPVPKDRKCFRLINGVLVERTVADVIPALQTNADGLKNVLDGFVKEYKKKQEEMENWKVRRPRALFLSPCPFAPGEISATLYHTAIDIHMTVSCMQGTRTTNRTLSLRRIS